MKSKKQIHRDLSGQFHSRLLVKMVFAAAAACTAELFLVVCLTALKEHLQRTAREPSVLLGLLEMDALMMLFYVLGGIVIFAAVYFRLLDRTIRDLGEISAAMQNISEGDLNTSVEVHGDDEVAMMAENLNKMDAGIKKNADDIEQLQQHTYDAELDGTSTNAPQTKAVYEALQQINVETDTTLSVAGKAADAAATGEAVADVKTAFSDTLGIHEIALLDNHSIGNGASSAVVIPSNIQTENGYACCCVECQENDAFVINGRGGNTTRLWSFSDANGAVLSISDRTADADKLVIIAPENAKYFAANLNKNYPPYWVNKGAYTDKTLTVDGKPADAKETGDRIKDVSDNLIAYKESLNIFETDMLGANKRVFNVTAGTTHKATKGFWPIALKSGTQYSIDLTSDAITGYQLYVYYTDGTNERIYSGNAFSNTYIASKDIESFGFYIASTFITASGEVAATLAVSNGFYDKTVNMQDTLEMTHDIVGENILTCPITAGVAISASAHEIPVVIDSGKVFSIKILTLPYGAVTAVQYFLMYADGTNEQIYSSSYSLVYRGIAKKKISAIRLYVGATGVVATGTCTIIIKQLDNTMASRLVAEINKNYAIKVVNHRGYNTAPENTIPAYILSYKAGFKYVETDVQLTSDGVPVLLHDGTINRTARTATGEELSATINISDITYEQALTYDFGIYKGTEYAGTKIPTLREFVLLCKRLSLHPYIEIKPTGFTEEQVKELVDIVISCGMRDNVTWISQNYGYLAYVSNYCNKCRLGLIVSSVTSDNVLVAAGLKTTNNAVFVNSGSITADAVTLCIGQNLPLEYWTLNTESNLTTIDPYVSGISSDSINVAEYYIDRVLSTGTATWS